MVVTTIGQNRESEESELKSLFSEPFRGMFELHVAPKLKKRSEIKFFKMAFKNTRAAMERLKWEEKFNIHSLIRYRNKSSLGIIIDGVSMEDLTLRNCSARELLK